MNCSETRGWRRAGSTSFGSGSCRRAGGPRACRPTPVRPRSRGRPSFAYDTKVSRGLNAYALAQFVAALLLAFGAPGGRTNRSLRGELIVAAVLVLWALLNIGGIFEHRRWALISELFRLPVTAALLAVKLPDGSWLVAVQAGLAMAVVALWLFLLSHRHQFDAAPQLPSRIIGGHQAPHAELVDSRPAVTVG